MAYVDPTAAGYFMQSLYLALMTAMLALVSFPHRLKAAVIRLWAAAGRVLRRRGKPHDPDTADG
jgi:hypothetical protein